jgi:hypothetical protein
VLEQDREHVRVEQPGQVYFGVLRAQMAQRGFVDGSGWFAKDGLGGRDGWRGVVVFIPMYYHMGIESDMYRTECY